MAPKLSVPPPSFRTVIVFVTGVPNWVVPKLSIPPSAILAAPSSTVISGSVLVAVTEQYRLGNYQEAMQLLQRALDLLNDGEIAAHLGQVLWDMGQEEKALAVWRDALNAFPEHPALQQIIERYPQQLYP